MFHLGDHKPAREKIAAYAKDGEHLVLDQRDAEPDLTGLDRYHPGAEGLLLDASGLSMAAFDELIRDAIETYSPLLSSVTRILDDLLRQCGARMSPLELREVKMVQR